MNLVRPNTDDFSVFVGDLAPDVTDYVLQETFRQYYPSVRSAKVIVDPATGRSKGYGFVRFASEAERDRSLELQGLTLSNRPIRVSLATARRSPSAGMPGTHPAELDPTNTTLFIGGLAAGVSEEQLRAIFVRYGDVVYTKIPQGKGCGFVQYVSRADAEAAMAEMNGQVVGTSAIRISWGRSTSRTAALQARPGVLPALGGGGFAGVAGLPVYSAGLDAYGGAAVTSLAQVAGGAGFVGGAPGGAVDLGGGLYQVAFTSGYPVAAMQGYGTQLAAYGLQLGGGGGQLLAGPSALQPPAQQQAGVAYDPLAGVDLSKLNGAFMQRQQPALSGAFMRPA